MLLDHQVFFLGALALALVYVVVLPRVGRNTPLVRDVVVFAALFFVTRYIVWRAYGVFAAADASLSYAIAVVVFGIEVFHSLIYFGTMRLTRRRTYRTLEIESHYRWWGLREPRVDVLVPTFNEKYDVLERTFVGIRHLAYRNLHVHVLDDGRREWVHALAKEFGFDYVTRATNAGFKAGNLNHAIGVLRARGAALEYLAVFDADFVPRPEFVARTLSLLGPANPDVAVVQTPQFFFNPDPFQHAFRSGHELPDDARAFYNHHLPSMDDVGAAWCCGSSFLARYEALAAIGLFPTESITEDVFATFKLRDIGWRTIYLNEVLSVGLAAEGVGELLKQRYRWCLGWLQVCHLRHARKRRHTPGEVWDFVKAIARWPLPSTMRVVWTFLPLIAIAFDSPIYDMTDAEFAGIRVPQLVAHFGLTWLSGYSIMPFFTDGQSLFVGPSVYRAFWNFYSGRQNERFSVTDKGLSRDGWAFHWMPARLPLLLLAISLGVLVWQIAFRDGVGRFDHLGMVLWTLLNCVSLYVALVCCFEPPQRRRAVRFPCALRGSVETGPGERCEAEIVDLSELGARIRGRGQRPLPRDVTFALHSPHVTRAARVCGVGADGTTGLEFLQSTEERRELIRLVLASPGVVPEKRRWDGLRGLRFVAAHLFSPALEVLRLRRRSAAPWPRVRVRLTPSR